MHGKLISEGKVEKLTYKQLRRLELIDAKKEKEIRNSEIAKEIIKSVGSASEGFFAGAGLAIQGFLSGDAIAFAAKSAAGLLVLDWVLANYPNFSQTFHLDTWPGGTPPTPPPPSGEQKIQSLTIGGRTYPVLYGPFDSHDAAVAYGLHVIGSPRYRNWLVAGGPENKWYIIQPGALGGI